MRRTIRLTESELRNMISESVKRVLKENFKVPSNWKETEFRGTFEDEDGALYMPDDYYDEDLPYEEMVAENIWDKIKRSIPGNSVAANDVNKHILNLGNRTNGYTFNKDTGTYMYNGNVDTGIGYKKGKYGDKFFDSTPGRTKVTKGDFNRAKKELAQWRQKHIQ